ncbi:MAG: hypothetical protein Tsb0010_17790 [Parvularculaceae bacterium]
MHDARGDGLAATASAARSTVDQATLLAEAPIGARRPELVNLALKLSNVPDNRFIEQYCREVGALLDMSEFFVGRLNLYTNLMRTICLVQNGRVVDNIVYNLNDTPCERVMDTAFCIYERGVADLFPRDEMLREMGVESYAGARIHGEDGKPLGIVVGLRKSPLKDQELAQSVLEFFHDRLAFQLQAAESLDRYIWAYSGDSEGFWDWDLQTGEMMISESVSNMLGVTGKRRPNDLSELEQHIHPDDRDLFIRNMRSHTREGECFEMLIRLLTGEGEHRWFRANGRCVRSAADRALRMVGSLTDVHKWVRDGSIRPTATP